MFSGLYWNQLFLSVHVSVCTCVSICLCVRVQNISQSAGGGIRPHLVTALVLYMQNIKPLGLSCNSQGPSEIYLIAQS